MSKEILNPDSLAAPPGYNHGILVDGGKTLFIAGQDGADADGTIVAPDDLVEQYERTLRNVQAVVQEAGGTMDDIVKLDIYVADRDDYVDNLEPLGEVFGEYFDEYPTMGLFEVNDFFHKEALVELEGIAVIDAG